MMLDNGTEVWAFSSSQYVQNAVGNIEKYLRKMGKSLPKRANTPLSLNYRPETDMTPELEPAEASYYQSFCYKLRMMGMPCDFPSFIFGDNKLVLTNLSNQFSMLKKKSSSIAYHFVQEGVAKDKCHVAYINMHDNLADLLTKPLPNGDKRNKFIMMVLNHNT